jgi:hypothetical protein
MYISWLLFYINDSSYKLSHSVCSGKTGEHTSWLGLTENKFILPIYCFSLVSDVGGQPNPVSQDPRVRI